MTRITTVTAAAIFAVLIALSTRVPVHAATRQDPQVHHPDSATQPDPTAKPQQMQRKAAQQDMMAKMQAMDAELDRLVATINASAGQAKIDAMAEAIVLMVRQRAMMQDQMMQMHGAVMDQMMQRMGNIGKPPDPPGASRK